MNRTEKDRQETHPPKNSWICENEKTLLSSPVMELIERQCRSSEQTDHRLKFYLLRSKDWCNIIPITEDGKIVMVKQYRIGVSKHTLEIPGGVIDPEDEHYQAAAIRELQEETGYMPLPGAQCLNLGWVFPNPAIMDNRCHSYVIGPVRKNAPQNLDPGEMIEVVEVPIMEIPEKILNGEVSHSLMLNTFFLLALQSHRTSHFLIEALNRFARPVPTTPESLSKN